MKLFGLALVSFIVLGLPLGAFGAGKVIEFHIRPGTGQGPWNKSSEVVEVKTGQTLRIINDDTTVHRLHTTGGKPCLHAPSDLQKGEFYDCIITDVADPAVDFCYDHNFGESSRFYIQRQISFCRDSKNRAELAEP